MKKKTIPRETYEELKELGIFKAPWDWFDYKEIYWWDSRENQELEHIPIDLAIFYNNYYPENYKIQEDPLDMYSGVIDSWVILFSKFLQLEYPELIFRPIPSEMEDLDLGGGYGIMTLGS